MIDPQSPDFENTPVSPKRPLYHYSLKSGQENPVVSIITPFYNTGEVFHQTAQSVLNQSLQQFEWLIVNDGSTDPEALRILDEYRGKDRRIRVIDHPKNLGLSAARNSGVREARTGYILFLDSDDLLEPTAAEKWWWFLESHPEFSFVGAFIVGFEAQQYLWRNGFHSNELNLTENQVVITSMVRREVFEKVNGFDEQMTTGLEDWDFWLRCANQDLWGGTVPEFLIWYRRREFHSDRWEDHHQKGIENFRNIAREKYPRLWDTGFPVIKLQEREAFTPIRLDCPPMNVLGKLHRRILFLIPWMKVGGADKFNLNLMRQLQKSGWEITIVCTQPTSSHEWLPEFAKITSDIFILPNFIKSEDTPRFLEYLIRSRNFDITIISNSLLSYLLLPYLVSRFPILPFVDYTHSADPGWLNGGYPNFSMLFRKFLTLQIVTSHSLRDWMIEQGANPQKVKVCYVNVDVNEWTPNPSLRKEWREKNGIEENMPVIVFNGRLTHQKQPDIFVKVLLQLHIMGFKFKGYIIGNGPLFEDVSLFIRQNKMNEYVVMLGEIPNDQVRVWMNASDIFFLPSSYEGIALSLFEAMALGLVTVAADVGGQRELVSSDVGFLVKHTGDDAEIREYIACLSQLLTNPELRNIMGNTARQKIILKHTVDTMGELMNSYFDLAITRHHKLCQVDQMDYGTICAQDAIEYLYYPSMTSIVDFPPASASTYFYLAIRALFMQLYQSAKYKFPFLETLKDYLKRILMRGYII